MGTLTVPRDSFELMYRLGQKTVQFKGVKVENYAPYLLKDGIVQKVTVLQVINRYLGHCFQTFRVLRIPVNTNNAL